MVKLLMEGKTALLLYFSPREKSVKSAQETSLSVPVRSLPSLLPLPYSLSSMVTRLIFTAGALTLLGSRGGMDINTSSPSTT